MKKFKLGDIFRDYETGDTWEVIAEGSKPYEDVTAICIEAGDGYQVGQIHDWQCNFHRWKYLGNHAKSNNFKNIYDILNDGTEA
jgi:hypothetical protein